MKLRRATSADVPAMHRVRLAVRENVLSDPARVRPEDYHEYLATRGRGWVVELDGRVVGFAVADRRTASVWALFVEPGAEGRGIGRRLHDTLVAWLFAAGCERLWLTTEPGTRAQRFYEAAGWRVAGAPPPGQLRYELERPSPGHEAGTLPTGATRPGSIDVGSTVETAPGPPARLPHLRVARPVSDLARTTEMYRRGLGLVVLGSFEDHDGFDGVMLGRPGSGYHLELTRSRRHPLAPTPGPEDLLVLYLPDEAEWEQACARLLAAGFRRVDSFNPYWEVRGRTFADPDGYRLVLQREEWRGDADASG